GDQVADADRLQAVGRDGADLLPDGPGVHPLDAQHDGHVGAVDVGVEQADAGAALQQRQGDVDADRRLADAALPGADGDAVAGPGYRLPPGDAAGAGDVAVPGDVDPGDALDATHEGGLDVLADAVAHGAGGGREHQPHVGGVALDAEVADHVEGHQVAVQLG